MPDNRDFASGVLRYRSLNCRQDLCRCAVQRAQHRVLNTDYKSRALSLGIGESRMYLDVGGESGEQIRVKVGLNDIYVGEDRQATWREMIIDTPNITAQKILLTYHRR